MNTNEDRMEALEKQVGLQRRWNIGLATVVLIGGLMAATTGQEVPEVIQAGKFEVVNSEGKVAIRMSSLQDSISEANIGSGVVQVMSRNGLPAATIACGMSGGWLTVSGTTDEKKMFKTGLTVAEDDHGGNWLGGLFLRNGMLRKNDLVHLTMTPEGDGIIKTYDSEGKVTSTSP